MEKRDYDAYYMYLKKKEYPPGLSKGEKRAIRRFATSLSIVNDKLYYTRNSDNQKRVITVDERQAVLESCHSHPTAGHFGIDKT